MKNKIFAIPAAAPAIPPNPNIPATIATISNIIVQRNIIKVFWFYINIRNLGSFLTFFNKSLTILLKIKRLIIGIIANMITREEKGLSQK